MINLALTGGNDTAAIQAAVDALPSTGGIINISEGVGGMAGGIVVNKPNVVFQGAHKKATSFHAIDGSNIVSMFDIYGAGCEFNDLAIDGNRGTMSAPKDGTAHGNPNTAAITVVASGFRFRRSEIKEVNFQGIIAGVNPGVSRADDILLDDVDIHHCGDTSDRWGCGFKATGGLSRGRFRNSRFGYNFGLFVPTGTSYGGGALALDMFDVEITNLDLENCYNQGGMISDNGPSGTQRMWLIDGVRSIINEEPSLASTSVIELTGLQYIVTNCRARGGKGAFVVFEPVGDGVCGDAVVANNVILGMDAAVNLLNSPGSGPGSGNGRSRNVTVHGNKGWTLAYGVWARSRASKILVADNNWQDVTMPLKIDSGADITQANNL